MEVAAAVETRRPIRETPAQRLLRETRAFFAALTRVILLSAILIPILLAAFLTVDLPIHSLDQFFSLPSVKPGNWLTMGLFIMSLAPLVAILIARRFGGDEASRVITASWGVAALLTFAEISYLSPLLEDGDMPSVTFVVAFVGGAMVGQYVAAAVYDVIRGGPKWWRAPLLASLCGYAAHSIIYFSIAYWTAPAPWLNWMVEDFGLKALMAFAFLGVYWMLRKPLKPRGGFGG
ncbi:MAG: VUT family protein [Parvularculaceae bacterium]